MANMNEVLGNIPEDSENRDDITVCLKMFIWKWVPYFCKETDCKFAVILQLAVALMTGKNGGFESYTRHC
jgi:hypothetical protein